MGFGLGTLLGYYWAVGGWWASGLLLVFGGGFWVLGFLVCGLLASEVSCGVGIIYILCVGFSLYGAWDLRGGNGALGWVLACFALALQVGVISGGFRIWCSSGYYWYLMVWVHLWAATGYLVV